MLKKHFKSFIIKKNRKFVKQSEIITYQPRTFQNPESAAIQSVITQHPEASHKLSITIGKGKKFVSNSTLYNDTIK